MEHVGGENLAETLRRLGPPNRDKALDIACQICRGLDAAHAQGVIHRDLKPSNLIIGPSGTVKIADFGIAGDAGDGDAGDGDEERASTELAEGTPAYLSPEQVSGNEATHKSDLFAVGVVLHELFTGHRPLRRPQEQLAIAEEDPLLAVSPSPSLASVPPAVRELIRQALSYEPARRPTSASAMATTLATLHEHQTWEPSIGALVPGRDQWSLVERLTQAASPELWLAHHRDSGEPRVFKFCLDENGKAHLERELAISQALHRGLGARTDLTRLLDWNLDHRPYFLEMEYSTLGDLRQWSHSVGGLDSVSLEDRLTLAIKIAEALSAAHSVGVLHGDLKPDNVLLTATAAPHDIGIRLADFGLGRLIDAEPASATPTADPVRQLEPTADSVRSGSSSTMVLYLAPEILEGKTPTTQSDIYSLGVLTYQLVVGDLCRALAPGWERHIDDDLLREDIAAAVEGDLSRRVRDAGLMANRLTSLDQRRARRHAEHQEQVARNKLVEQAERDAQKLTVLRRRRKWLSAAALVLLALLSVVLFQERRARAAARLAVERADESRAATEFLLSLFESGKPGNNPGGSIDTVRLLKQGALRSERELQGQPGLQAKVDLAIASIYQSLGLNREARPLVTRAIDRAVAASDTTQAAHGWRTLATTERRSGNYQESLDAAQRSVVLLEQTQAPRHEQARGHLEAASTLRSMHEYERALSVAERVVGLLGPDPTVHPELMAEALADLSQTKMRLGLLHEAEQHAREALALRRRYAPHDEVQIASSLHRLAFCLSTLGQNDEAVSMLEEAVEIKRRAYPNESQSLIASINNLALLRLNHGEIVTATATLRELLAMRERVGGPDHPGVATGQSNLARALHLQGQLQEAESLLRRAVAIRSEKYGADAIGTLQYKTYLARLLVDRGQLSAARSLAEDVLSGTSEQEQLWFRSLAHSVIAIVEAKRGRQQQAVVDLRQSLEELTVSRGRNSVEATLTRSALEAIEASPSGDHVAPTQG